MIPWLENNPVIFPNPETAQEEPNGLLAAGGNLESDTLITAYKKGIFPWFDDDSPILWWSPNPRSVIKPSDIHISKSMRKTLKKTPFKITCDTAFEQVIRRCSKPRNYTDDTWITEEMVEAYCNLHNEGIAHSVEVWEGNNLVGGLYGICIGRMFFGESMFSNVDNASKIAFITLCKNLADCHFELIDCQVSSEHLNSLGAIDIDRQLFTEKIDLLCNEKPSQSPWQLFNQ